MPKSDTWPGCVAMEPLINNDKAGSCDSVVSMNSSYNDDSLEYLSPEERACLMFLESTIESLEMEEDSGLSSDGSDPSNLGTKHGHQSMGQTRLEDVSNLQNHNSGIDQKSFLNAGVPSPHLANGLASMQLKAPGATTPLKDPGATTHLKAPAAAAEFKASRGAARPSALVSEPKATALKPTALAGAVEPKATIVAVQARTPGAVTYPKPQGAVSEPTLPEVGTVPKPLELAADHKPSEPAIHLQVAGLDTARSSATSCLPVDEFMDNMPKGVSVDSKHSKQHAGVPIEQDMKLIPPPSDFRDDEPEKDRPSATELRGPLTYSELEQLRNKVSMKRTSTVFPGAQEAIHSKLPVDLPVKVSADSTPSHLASTISSPQALASTITSPAALEPKSPPAVAPKPKRIPPNIVIKSHKSDSPSGSHQHSPIDRSSTDPQIVRLEALRKLGLLKCDEEDSGTVVSVKPRKAWVPPPPHSPAADRTQAPAHVPNSATTALPPAVPAPASTPAPHTAPGQITTRNPPTVPAPPTTPAPTPHTTQAPTSAQAPPFTSTPASTRVSHTTPIPVPAPAEFSDNAKTLAAPPTAPKHIPPLVGFKSASLERSGMGLSSYMAGNTFLKTNQCPSSSVSPGDLRSSRRRPASLGAGKDFVNVLGEASQPQPCHREAQNKLPRSQGISVLISPNSKNGEDRREALKKLGLLRD